MARSRGRCGHAAWRGGRDEAGAGLALLATIAWLWLTEALPVSVTALLATAAGVLTFDEALLNFADPVIFLFLGGFALAAGLQRQGLDRWMAWGLPLVLVMMPLMELGLRLALKPQLAFTVDPPPAPGAWTPAQQRMLVLFGATVLRWVFGAPLGTALGCERGYDAAVALLALVLLHALRIASWQDVERSTEWGGLLLFSAGLPACAGGGGRCPPPAGPAR